MLGSACSYKALARLDDSGAGEIDAAVDSGAAEGSDDAGDAADSGVAPAAAVCFGTAIVWVCLQAAPTTALTVSSFALVNADEAAMRAPPASSNGDYCVVAARSITVESLLRAVGKKPLVLVAIVQIVTSGSGVI